MVGYFKTRARIHLPFYSSGSFLIGRDLTIHHDGNHGSMYDVYL